MLFFDVPVIIYAVYIPILIVLFILELIAIVKYRKHAFSSSFFKIFAALVIVNIASCLLGTFVFRLNLYSLVNGFYANLMEQSKWLTAAYIGAYYLNCLSETLGALLATNRFTALFFPLQHNQVWHWRTISSCVLLCSLISIAPVWFLFENTTAFVQHSERMDYYVVRSTSPHRHGSIWFNMALVTVCCTGLSTLLYIACSVRMCVSVGARNRRAERNLFLTGFFSMLCSLPYMIAMLMFYINLTIGIDNGSFNPDLMSFFTFQLPWLTDLKYLTPGPMLLITNKSIRNKIMKMSSSNSNDTHSIHHGMRFASFVVLLLIVSVHSYEIFDRNEFIINGQLPPQNRWLLLPPLIAMKNADLRQNLVHNERRSLSDSILRRYRQRPLVTFRN